MTSNNTESRTADVREPALDQPYPGISFKEASTRMVKKWRVFSGRASISEYWWAVLYVWIVNTVFLVMDTFFDSFRYAVWVWALIIIIPMLSLSVRRLHDANMSGWWAPLMGVCGIIGSCLTVSPVIKVIAALGITDPAQFIRAAISGTMQQFGGGEIAVVLIGMLLTLASVVAEIVLYTRPSKPEGVRFDK